MKINNLLLLVLLSMSHIVCADSSLEILDNVRKDLHALSAEFIQYEIDPNERMSEQSTGHMWLSAPDQFKWIYKYPAPQLIIANGDKVWIYDEDLDQVTIKQQDSTQNPLYVLLNKQQTEENYIIEKVQSEDQQVQRDQNINWISLTPKAPSDEIKQVWIGLLDNNIKILKLKNQLDNTVVFEFNQMVKNPVLTEDFFTFIVPEVVDVISDAALDSEF
jgi:outer membrane lipoprotein carrier protein